MGTRTSPCSAFERSPVDRRGCGESPMAGLTPTIARQPIRDQKADYVGSHSRRYLVLGTGVTLGLLFGAVSFLYATVGHSTRLPNGFARMATSTSHPRHPSPSAARMVGG